MARQVGADEQEQGDSRSLIGISKPRLKATLAKLRSNRTEKREANEARREILSKAQDQDHAHLGAMAWIEQLDKMDAIKRHEKLFQFDLMRGHMGWDESDLLPDRAETPQARRARQPVEDDGAPASA